MRLRHRVAIVPLIPAFALLAGTAVPASSTEKRPEPREVTTEVGYVCSFPQARHEVNVRITATLPDSAAAGTSVAAERVAVRLKLPDAARAELASSGTKAISGTASLTVRVSQGGSVSTSMWDGMEIPKTPMPASGPLSVKAAGPVPAVPVEKSSSVTLTAAELSLTLTRHPSTRQKTGDLSVTCDVAKGEEAHIVTVPISAPRIPDGEPTTPSNTLQPQPRSDEGGTAAGEPQSRAAGTTAPPFSSADDDIPPGCVLQDIDGAGMGCSYATGYANVRKMNGAMLLGVPEPMFIQYVAQNKPSHSIPCDPPPDALRCFGIIAYLSAKISVPSATSTLLEFGFMPVRATAHISFPDFAPIEFRLIQITYPDHLRTIATFHIETSMSIRLSDVRVNGVPLDVGPHCGTAKPAEAVFYGHSNNLAGETGPGEYTPQLGGVLFGMVDIPEFSGCGVSGDLDPLITSAISSEDNYIKITASSLCGYNGTFCPPVIPEPRR